ncbi:WD40 repeat-like protein, partial [Glonium stellatum]
VIFSPDSKLVALSSDVRDKIVRLWDVITGAALQTLKCNPPIFSIEFSPNSKLVASSETGNVARLWDTTTGAALHMLKGHSDFFYSVVFSPNGNLVASGSGNGTILLWDIIIGALLQTLKGHLNWVISVAFSPDSKLVASSSYDNIVRLWDTVTGAALQTLSLGITIRDSSEQFRTLFVLENRVKEEGKNLLWLPPDYRATFVTVRSGMAVLGHLSGGISFLDERRQVTM